MSGLRTGFDFQTFLLNKGSTKCWSTNQTWSARGVSGCRKGIELQGKERNVILPLRVLDCRTTVSFPSVNRRNNSVINCQICDNIGRELVMCIPTFGYMFPATY